MHYFSTRFSSSYHICCSLGCFLWHGKRQDHTFVLPPYFKEGQTDLKGTYDVTVIKWSFPLFESSKMIHILDHLANLIGSYPSKLSEKFEIYCEYSFFMKRASYPFVTVMVECHFASRFLYTYSTYPHCAVQVVASQSTDPRTRCHTKRIFKFSRMLRVACRIRRHNVTWRRLNL